MSVYYRTLGTSIFRTVSLLCFILHPSWLSAVRMFAVILNKKRKRSEASSKALSYSVLSGYSALSSIRPAYRQSGCSPFFLTRKASAAKRVARHFHIPYCQVTLLFLHPSCLSAVRMFAVILNKERQRSEASSKALSHSVLSGYSAFSSIRPACRQSGCSPLS